jgi:hypothetical protein
VCIRRADQQIARAPADELPIAAHEHAEISRRSRGTAGALAPLMTWTSSRGPKLLASLVLATLAACGGAPVDAASTDASMESAICGASDRPVLVTKDGEAIKIAARASGDGAIATLDPGTTVVRTRTVEAAADHPVSFVEVKSGPHAGVSGWVDASALELRTPKNGACDNGYDYESKAHAYERVQSQMDPLPAKVVKDTIDCVLAAEQGMVEDAGQIRAWGEHMLASLREVWNRDRDLVIYALGSDAARNEARRRLVAGADADEAELRGIVASVAHALPAIHRQMSADWAFYRALDASSKGRYVCKLVGAVAYEAVLALMSGSATLDRSPQALARVDDANTVVARAAQIPEQEGAEGIIRVNPAKFKTTQEAAYWRGLQKSLDEIGYASGARQEALVRQVSEDINVPFWAKDAGTQAGRFPVGGGNCRNAAATTIFSLASGRLLCTLPYFPGEDRPIVDTFRRMGIFKEEIATGGDAAAIAKALEQRLGEGQLAYLRTGHAAGGHATAVVRIGGRLLSINNQSWYARLGVPAGRLQTLSEWTASWIRYAAGKGSLDGLDFRAIVTTLRLPERVG